MLSCVTIQCHTRIGCTRGNAIPEVHVSSTEDSATASVVPAGTPSSASNEMVLETPHESTAVTTQSAESDKQLGTPISTSCQPSISRLGMQMRERCYMLKTPPLNLAMENVSEYIDSDEAWLSDGFYSHQIGYRICLAIKMELSSDSDGMLNVMLGMISAEGMHSSYLLYPCSGFATVAILNPQANSDHKVLELMFILEKPTLSNCSEIVSEMVQVPRHFITQEDCIFFRVERIDMDEMKHKLWLLDATVDDAELCTGGESTEEVLTLQ